MPIYEYKCDKCEAEREVNTPMSKSAQVQVCTCGEEMRRIFSLMSFTMPETGREKILGTLNQEEDSRQFPGGDKHRTRYEQAMAKSLDQTRPTIGRGFG